MSEDSPLIITIAIDKGSGKLTNVTNIQKEDLPLLYKALRAIEEQIFNDIASMTTPPARPTDGYVNPQEAQDESGQVRPL